MFNSERVSARKDHHDTCASDKAVIVINSVNSMHLEYIFYFFMSFNLHN